MRPDSAWQALTLPPRRFLLSRWPWRSLAYLLTGVALGVLTFVVFYLIFLGVVLTFFFLVGVVLLSGFVLSGILVARIERRRLRLIDDQPVTDPHRAPPHRGIRSWVVTRVKEPITWREFAYTLVSIALWCVDAVVLTLALFPVALAVSWPFPSVAELWVRLAWSLLGVVLLPVMAYPVTAWAAARAEITRAVLAPKETELGRRLVAVTNSRARLVDAFEAERRRIERDLHDGTQQRLVALGVELGMARMDLLALDLPEGADDEVRARIEAARDQARLALDEIRELVRGVYPQLLVERGLEAAVTDLASRSAVPTEVDVVLARRLPESVEAAAWFAVSEALANVDKHAGATQVTIRIRLAGSVLVVDVTDDGQGGAEASPGGGLYGLVDRLAVLDGRLFLSSPTGGPTVVRMEIPNSSEWSGGDGPDEGEERR